MPSTTSTGSSVDVVRAALIAAGFAVGEPQPLTRTVLDTADGRLHAAGLRLELRAALKQSQAHQASAAQLILQQDGSPPAVAPVARAPRTVTDLPPGPLRARLAPVIEVRALLPLVTATSRRTPAVRKDREGQVLVAAAIDEKMTADGVPVAAAPVVEIVEVEGHPRAAAKIQSELARTGCEPILGDALDLALRVLGRDPRGLQTSPTIPLDPRAPALESWTAVMANLVGTIEATWDGTVDAVDPEFLHDFRVAVRRLRSVLAQGRRVLPAAARSQFREGFGRLGQLTGPARDLDVYVIGWDSYVAPLGAAARDLAPMLAHLEQQRRAAHRELAAQLRSDAAHQLVADLKAWLADPAALGAPGKEADRRLGRVVADRIADAQDQLLTRGRAIGPTTPAEELHELRKDAKKLRYLLECFGGLLPAGSRKTFVQHLKALQDNLGEHQDAEVHATQLRELSAVLHARGAAAPELLAAGRLSEHLEQRRAAAREEFAARFAHYDSRPTRAALRALLESIA